jgi:hypothetical protein
MPGQVEADPGTILNTGLRLRGAPAVQSTVEPSGWQAKSIPLGISWGAQVSMPRTANSADGVPSRTMSIGLLALIILLSLERA